MTNEITSPFSVFFDRTGQPLDNGYIYIGTAGINPEVSPITVYWDSSLTSTAAQPIRTLSGYPSRDGSPGTLIINATSYSIVVRDSAGALVFSDLNASADLSSPFADIASATTTDIGSAASSNLRVTGTTTIISFGTAPNGTRRTLRFTSALVLTHNASSLILPGVANITTAANDTADFISLGSGNWICATYKRANGFSVVTPIVSALTVAAGDGTTDDWAAINTLTTTLEAAGGGVVLWPTPPSFYRISRSLKMRTGVTHWVPSPTTRIVCTGDAAAPFNVWPYKACVEFGSYNIYNYSRAPSYAISNITAGANTITTTVAANAGLFVVGDIIQIESTLTYLIIGYTTPTQMQVNVVTSVNAATGVIGLRHPMTQAIVGAVVRRLTNTGSTCLNSSLVDTGEPLFATRDAAIIGGTWVASSTSTAFCSNTGHINCYIAPHRVQAEYGCAYGNSMAHNVFQIEAEEVQLASIELAYGSHDNDINIGSVTLLGTSSGVTGCVAAGESSRRNTVRIASLDIGASPAASVIQIVDCSENSFDILNIAGASAISADVVLSNSGGNTPNTSFNRVNIGRSALGTRPSYVIVNNAKCISNFVNGRFTGTITNGFNYGVVVSDGDKTAISGYYENGSFVSTSPATNTNASAAYFGGGITLDGTYTQFGAVVTSALTSQASFLGHSVNRDYDPFSPTFAAPWAETISAPIGSLKAGDRIHVKLAGSTTGGASTKTVQVSFAGTSIGILTIPAGTVNWTYETTLRANAALTGVSGTAIHSQGATFATLTPAIGALNLATTAYNIAINMAVANVADAMSVFLYKVQHIPTMMDNVSFSP